MKRKLFACTILFCSVLGSALSDTDRELDLLSRQLDLLQREEFNTEIESQPYMLDDASAYVKQIERAQQIELKKMKIQRRIAELQSQKQALPKTDP